MSDEKKNFKLAAAKTIQDLGSVLVPRDDRMYVIEMAAVLFHKLLSQCLLKNCQPYHIGGACVFIASAAKKYNNTFDEIARVLYHHTKPFGDTPTPSQLEIFNKDFGITTADVLDGLGDFDVDSDSWIADSRIEFPYAHLSKLTDGLEGEDGPRMKLEKAAVAITRLVLLCTDWSTRYPASTIACAVLNISALFSELILHDFIPEKWPKRWWTLIDSTTSMAIIREMTDEFMKDCRVNWEFYATMTQRIDPSVTLKHPALDSRTVKIEKPKVIPKKTQGLENKETKRIVKQEKKEYKPRNKVRHDLIEKINISSFAPQKASRMGLKLREPNAANKRPQAVLGDPLEDPKRICL